MLSGLSFQTQLSTSVSTHQGYLIMDVQSNSFIDRFPDPLAPAGSVPKKYPPGTNAQLEQEWLAMIDSAVKR